MVFVVAELVLVGFAIGFIAVRLGGLNILDGRIVRKRIKTGFGAVCRGILRVGLRR